MTTRTSGEHAGQRKTLQHSDLSENENDSAVCGAQRTRSERHGLCSPSRRGQGTECWGHWARSSSVRPHLRDRPSTRRATCEPACTPPSRLRTGQPSRPTAVSPLTLTRHSTGHIINCSLRHMEEGPNYPVGYLFWLV
uniref:Uncharacterized protein n=1 Tax=Rousettus aegyptiacus TaxID=9407 RepID=A0A7J8JH36_ROUAE|nr:hypothetical protein HJG63_010431 [Rousettus aegyptiacus]